jgi:hypothetical protein
VDTIAKSLVGDYRREHLLTLGQSLTAFRHYQELIGACDREIEKSLETFESKVDPESPLPKSLTDVKRLKGDPRFELRFLKRERQVRPQPTSCQRREASNFRERGLASWIGTRNVVRDLEARLADQLSIAVARHAPSTCQRPPNRDLSVPVRSLIGPCSDRPRESNFHL